MDRLDKWLCERTAFSRKEIKSLIRDGKVKINDTKVLDSSTYVHPNDIVELQGKILSDNAHIYIMLNKPIGVVSVSASPGEQTVIDLLPSEMRRKDLFPAGRLDKNTTGFVLITNDGAFAHRILSPRHHVTKKYTAELRDPARREYIPAFRDGILLSDGTKCLAADIEIEEDPHRVHIYLHEGRYHQVRRMFAALGNHVDVLHRDAIGGLYLDPSLQPGECRMLTEQDIEKITEELLP